MKNISLFIILTLFLLSCSGNSEKKQQKPTVKQIPVTGFIISQSDLSNSISVVGTLIANEEIVIKSPLNGNISKINFQEGKPVSKGQLIVQIDSRDWKSQLKSTEIQLQNLKKDYNRKKEIFKLNGISLEEVEKTESDIASLEATVEQLKVKIDYADIRAPFSGIAGLREVSPGSYLLLGDKITKLVNSNPIKIEFSVPMEYANSLILNSKINVFLRSTNDTIQATIYAKEPSIDQSTRNIRIRAQASNPKGMYLPGDFVEVQIPLKALKSIILVPNRAIVPKLNEQTVFVVREGKRWKHKSKQESEQKFGADIVRIKSGRYDYGDRFGKYQRFDTGNSF